MILGRCVTDQSEQPQSVGLARSCLKVQIQTSPEQQSKVKQRPGFGSGVKPARGDSGCGQWWAMLELVSANEAELTSAVVNLGGPSQMCVLGVVSQLPIVFGIGLLFLAAVNV